jgi:hypothetical protein
VPADVAKLCADVPNQQQTVKLSVLIRTDTAQTVVLLLEWPQRGGLRSAHATVFMCFMWISEQTAIISLYNINWLVFIPETECVYCAVWTGYLNVIQFGFGL